MRKKNDQRRHHQLTKLVYYVLRTIYLMYKDPNQGRRHSSVIFQHLFKKICKYFGKVLRHGEVERIPRKKMMPNDTLFIFIARERSDRNVIPSDPKRKCDNLRNFKGITFLFFFHLSYGIYQTGTYED